MKAIVRDKFGGSEVLEIQEVPKPELEDDSVLVRVRAASLNLGDWYGMTGRPYAGRVSMGLRKPKELLEAGKYRPVIDRRYPLEDIVEATKYVETGQKTGNVVLTVAEAQA